MRNIETQRNHTETMGKHHFCCVVYGHIQQAEPIVAPHCGQVWVPREEIVYTIVSPPAGLEAPPPGEGQLFMNSENLYGENL